MVGGWLQYHFTSLAIVPALDAWLLPNSKGLAPVQVTG